MDKTSLTTATRPTRLERAGSRRAPWAASLALGALALAGAGAALASPAAPQAGEGAAQVALDFLAREGAQALAPQGARIEVVPGQLDPRLRLAPCARVEPYLPAGSRAWGRTRIGLRCVDGPTAWNVFLPVTVRVHAKAVVLATSLPAGTVLDASHLAISEVDWAESGTPPLADPSRLVGRTLARPMAAGAAARATDLRPRQWFGAGETVRITARGQGFAISGEAQALSNGIEGQVARLRTEGGRIVSGVPVGPRLVEVAL